MSGKVPPKYKERFATSLEWFCLLVVEKSLSMWRCKVVFGILRSCKISAHLDPHEAIFEVWTSKMVVKAIAKYVERFATCLDWFGLFVVKINGLMWRCKLAVRYASAHLRVQVGSDPQKAIFGVWAQAMVVEAPFKYGEWFATSLEWFGLLVVESTGLMWRYTVAVRCASALASSSGLRPTEGNFWSSGSGNGC